MSDNFHNMVLREYYANASEKMHNLNVFLCEVGGHAHTFVQHILVGREHYVRQHHRTTWNAHTIHTCLQKLLVKLGGRPGFTLDASWRSPLLPLPAGEFLAVPCPPLPR
jgi:hypothetical protein